MFDLPMMAWYLRSNARYLSVALFFVEAEHWRDKRTSMIGFATSGMQNEIPERGSQQFASVTALRR